ncbi:MAG: AAA family ATPase [Bacilli bacterium]|nr:AAA family ATPase [Bacilli bacterium]MBN2876513.1 AAA family ATPase [Bacilli bacterium]
MDRILIIGSPGSGKSTLAKQLAKKTGIALLHLDQIFHIDNYNHISREELKKKIERFISENDRFIIDGNYSGTLPFRLGFSDTVILFNLDTSTCLNNVLRRIKDNLPRDDIASGFDNSILHEDFIEYVKHFRTERLPYIRELLKDFPGEIIQLDSYQDVDRFLKSISFQEH